MYIQSNLLKFYNSLGRNMSNVYKQCTIRLQSRGLRMRSGLRRALQAFVSDHTFSSCCVTISRSTLVFSGTLQYTKRRYITCVGNTGQMTAKAQSNTSGPSDQLRAFNEANTSQNNACEKITTYMRPLPPGLTSLSSPAGKESLLRALCARTAEGFFALCGTFASQSETTLCGPASLAAVLNAFGVDPGVRQPTWRGSIWRWFSDDALVCREPGLSAKEIRESGVTLDALGRLAACHGLSVRVSYASDTHIAPSGVSDFGVSDNDANSASVTGNIEVSHASYSEFLRDVTHAATTGETHVIVSFSRAALGQTGDGHFSPIGAVDFASETALVLDVARFKYPSYWANLRELYDSMARIDSATGRPRGYIVLARGQSSVPCTFCADT